MLWDWFENHLSQNEVPFAALLLFVAVVGLSLWFTPMLARWIDRRKRENRVFYDDMLQKPPADEQDE